MRFYFQLKTHGGEFLVVFHYTGSFDKEYLDKGHAGVKEKLSLTAEYGGK